MGTLQVGPSEIIRVEFRFFKLNFFSCLKLLRKYSPSVFLKDGLKLYVLESQKFKSKL